MSKEAPRHKLCNGVKNLFFKKSLGVLLCLRLLKLAQISLLHNRHISDPHLAGNENESLHIVET